MTNHPKAVLSVLLTWSLLINILVVVAFAPKVPYITRHYHAQTRTQPAARLGPLEAFKIVFIGDEDGDEGEEEEDDDDDEPEEEDPYTQVASSEFQNGDAKDAPSSALTFRDELQTMIDWGGALGSLRQRVEDVESGKSQDPSHTLYRVMSSQSPNQLIGQFVSSANPQVVQAMSGAVSSLLGGLSNPTMGMETMVRASGQKIGSLCFQLQMTGYMFRNAEYVLALKDLLDLRGEATLEDYKRAFDKLDVDRSGYIETSEIEKLFNDIYDGETPKFEVEAFLQFFDVNKDGKISWEEFENGLGSAMANQMAKADAAVRLLQGDDMDDDDDDDDDEIGDVSASVSGIIEIELEDGRVVEVEAKEYMESLKMEARALKEALNREKMGGQPGGGGKGGMEGGLLPSGGSASMDITSYIASRQGDVKSLTEGISPEVMETMKRLVHYVLEGGDSGKAKTNLSEQQKAEMEMELPGSALQQLALWQLVLGYRLREAEATGEYMKLLE